VWDFLVGEAPGFAAAAAALVFYALALRHTPPAVVFGLPALAAAALAAGVWHGRRRAVAQRLSSTATKASSGSPPTTSVQHHPVPSTSEVSSRSERNSQESHGEASWR
jgi:hypothetical protein